MEAVKGLAPEYLSSDIFEDSFLGSFIFIYRVQYILGCCRLHIKDRFATPPTIGQKVYTIFCILLSTSASFALSSFYVEHTKRRPTYIYLVYCNTGILISAFLCNIIHVRFLNGDKNVEFLVRLQKIDRLLQIERLKIFNTVIKNNVFIPVCVILTIAALLVIFEYVQEGKISFVYWGAMYLMLTILLELTVLAGIILFFVLRITYINCIMENHLQQKTLPMPVYRGYNLRAYIRYYAQETRSYYENSDTNIYLREIFQCFIIYQDLYKFQVFVFCIQIVLSSVFAFGLLLYSIQLCDTNALSDITNFAIQSVVDAILALTLAFRYELFFSEVRKTKKLCINIMAKHTEGPLREKARTMLKMIEETPPRFSVYEMWDMNASTFVSMFGLITSLIVTILQFVFL